MIECRVAEDRKILVQSLGLALLIELLVITVAGWQSHWLVEPKKTGLDTASFIEAQMLEIPQEAHLVERLKPVATAPYEAVLSKKVSQGREAKPDETQNQNENQTDSGAQLAANHGPVATFSPTPRIPSYLQDKELHASAIIDFFVSAEGITTPRLVGSSGNEELDSIAIETAKKWRFSPAEKTHQPLDAKVRLRIVFEVQ